MKFIPTEKLLHPLASPVLPEVLKRTYRDRFMQKYIFTICYFGFKDAEILSFIAQSYLCQYAIQLIIIAFHLISICKSLYKFYPNIF